MSPSTTRQGAPTCADELLLLLRRARLLDEAQIARLTTAALDTVSPTALVEKLLCAHLLTPYQVEQVLAGRLRRLRLGPFLLLDQLGNSGRVFRAEHPWLRRTVVLKLLRRGQRREIETVGRLSHPNIVAAQHAGRMRGRIVLVLEYVDGVDLERLIEETGPVPLDLVVEIARQATAALAHLHHHGLVHRDVKPANLLLAHVGSQAEPLVKLVDLGLACPTREASAELCGTVDYLAPERAEGRCDIRADLYGLGCTLYHILTGQPPFPGGSWPDKLLRHRLEKPRPIRQLRPETPRPLAALVNRLMAADPAHRPATPAAVARELAVLPGPRRKTRSGRRRGWRALRFLMAILLGTICGTLVHWVPVPGGAAQPFSLAEALEQATDGDEILVPAGVHRSAPLVIRRKGITLRASHGTRPVLMAEGTLLTVECDAVIAGVELVGGVRVAGACLTLRDSKVTQSGKAALIEVERGRLDLRNCELQAERLAIALVAGEVHAEEGEWLVRDVAGTALLVRCSETSQPNRVRLQGVDVRASRIATCQDVSAPIEVRLERCQLRFLQALLSVEGDATRWREHVRWSGDGNRYHGTTWLRVHNRAQAVWDERAWRRFWGE